MLSLLDPTEVSKAVQLLQVGTLISAITRKFAMFPCTVSSIKKIPATLGELDRDIEGP